MSQNKFKIFLDTPLYYINGRHVKNFDSTIFGHLLNKIIIINKLITFFN